MTVSWGYWCLKLITILCLEICATSIADFCLWGGTNVWWYIQIIEKVCWCKVFIIHQSFTNFTKPYKKGVKSNVRLFYACSTNSTKLTAFLGNSLLVILPHLQVWRTMMSSLLTMIEQFIMIIICLKVLRKEWLISSNYHLRSP